jgi:mobilome CxxCx(11)CxxC protein
MQRTNATDRVCSDCWIAIAAFAGVVQLVFSAWSLVYSWTDNLEYSLESAAENFDLSLKFRELGAQAESPPDDLILRVTELKAKDVARQRADAKNGVTEKELRYAHRAGLRQFGRACDKCGEIPCSMEPTPCPVCGNF